MEYVRRKSSRTKVSELDYVNKRVKLEYDCFIHCIKKIPYKYVFLEELDWERGINFITTFIVVEDQHKEVLKILTDKQKDIYWLHYIKSYKQSEIAQYLGISKQLVFKHMQLIDKKIYKVLSNHVMEEIRIEEKLESQ
ncbi:sigma factor-like helix-turn-helix DNA-binding protein [Clostridium celatum]|uniref:sigma factor-like helix-turn-helix DNA-binding protein n=1 Tax=Clostridium celatum TaxID=36834 RepID=UPI00189B836E|nr:sigma factor-like helix-turn-helix DNA-binding protein [Clostridium celatum]